MTKNNLSCDCKAVDLKKINRIKKKMPDSKKFDSLTAFFKAFADRTRIKIIYALLSEELCVCDIANLLNMTHSAISHQLGVLKKLKLVKFIKKGKEVYYSLDDDHIKIIFNNGYEHILEDRRN